MRAVITGSGREIPPNRITNDMLARVMDTSDEWVQARSGIETRYFVDEGVGTLRPRRGRLGTGDRDGGYRQGRDRPRRLCHDDARSLLPRLGWSAPAQARPHRHPLLRHPSAVRGLRLWPADGRRADPFGIRQERPARRRRDSLGVHALRLRAPLRRRRRSPD